MWLKDEDESLAWYMGLELNRNGLRFVGKNRRNKKGGGLGLIYLIDIDSILIRSGKQATFQHSSWKVTTGNKTLHYKYLLSNIKHQQ